MSESNGGVIFLPLHRKIALVSEAETETGATTELPKINV